MIKRQASDITELTTKETDDKDQEKIDRLYTRLYI